MKKYIVIKADYNDGDYSTKKTEITDEQIITIKEIFSKMPKTTINYIRYETRQVGNYDKQNNSNYDYITYQEKKFLDTFLPIGDPQYCGIHTIVEIEIVQQLEKII